MYEHTNGRIDGVGKKLQKQINFCFFLCLFNCILSIILYLSVFITVANTTHNPKVKTFLAQRPETSTLISEKTEPITLQQPSVEKTDTIQPLISHLEKLEQDLKAVKQNFSDTLKVQYLKADPENPDCVEEEPLPDGSKNIYQYLTIPLDGIKEVIGVETCDTEGRWHEIQDFEIRKDLLFIQSSEFIIRFDELGGQTQQFVKLRKEFKVFYR